QLAPDVIVTSYRTALGAVLQRRKMIPIVFTGAGDPVERGWVRNQAHPEGNATGFPNGFGLLGGKWLELLKGVAPTTCSERRRLIRVEAFCVLSTRPAITGRASRCDSS